MINATFRHNLSTGLLSNYLTKTGNILPVSVCCPLAGIREKF